MGSCAVTPEYLESRITDVFDENVPTEQRAVLHIPAGHFEVFEFSGRPVRWFKLVAGGRGNNVHIPSGEHTIRFHYYPGGDTGARNNRNKAVTANFEAGRAYALIARQRGSTITIHVQDVGTRELIN